MARSTQSERLRAQFKGLNALLVPNAAHSRVRPIALKRDAGEDRVFGTLG